MLRSFRCEIRTRQIMTNKNMLRTALMAGLALWQMPSRAADAQQPVSKAMVQPLMDKDLEGVPGKELLMLTVEYLPGGASLPHRHDAQVCVYVLQGELIMQVEGSPPVTLRRGQTFYENRTDVHVVSANASKTAPAKILVFMVKDKNAPVSRDVAAKESS
jgi:quercetin dioxygenase-like cupin family protein